jgi:N-acetylglucosaminyldiphosphoundecaprenol N-acetyl-beta-D-mannosaminyltransferase
MTTTPDTDPVAAAVVAGVPVDAVSTEQALAMIGSFVDEGRTSGRTFQVATVNVDFVVNAKHNADVLAIMQRAELNIADGMPVVWGARLMGIEMPERVTGADLVPQLVERSRATGWKILLFGSAEGVAEQAAAVLLERSPGADVVGISGPMMADVRAMDTTWFDAITEYGPDIICVALGNPKQERWIDAHRQRLGAAVLIGVGGTLDFLVGGRRRAPNWMQRAGLEWIYRALQEPKRLGKRYFHDGVIFGPIMLHALWQRRRAGHPSGHSRITIAPDGAVDVTGPVSYADAAQLVGIARRARRAGTATSLRITDPRATTLLDQLQVPALFEGLD